MLNLTAADVASPTDVKRAKYRRLADAIRTKIRDGHLKPGQDLPGEVTIAEEAGVARSVVRQALILLEREGILDRRNGVRARVAEMRVTPAAPVRKVRMKRYVDQNRLMAEGKRPDTSAFAAGHGIDWDDYTIAFNVRHELATPKDRELLKLPEGAMVWRREFLKFAAGVPVEIQRSALPEWVVEGNPFLIDPDRQPYRGGTQWELFDAGFHVRVIEQSGIPRMPTENEERDLRIRQVPVWEAERVMSIMRNGRPVPVEASRLILVGSKHVFVERVVLGKVDGVDGGLPPA